MYHKIKCCCETCECQNEIEVPDYVNTAICFDCGQKDHKAALSVASDTKPVIELSEDLRDFVPKKNPNQQRKLS